MKTRSIIAALLLLVAGLQTSWAQERGMKVWRNGSFKGYVVSRIDSIQFVNLAAGVDLSQNELTMEIGDSVLLTATVFPDNASNEVRWSSSNPDVASVSSYGMVTAISSGYSTIICHVIDGVDVEAECLVKVGNTDGIPVTCAEALELATALEDYATSVDFYSVTGYITEVVNSVSRNQQTFWMADTKDGGRVFEAYWANLPEGVAEFKAGMKVTIYGKLYKWVSTDGSKVTPEIINADVVILEDGVGTDINCAQAVELTNALADGATSTESYSVTGYITEVVGNVSRNQQTFWMADTKDGGRVFEAYWANLPEGVAEFKAGMKVTITGHLMKYVNSAGNVFCEMKNADVVILEDVGGETPVVGTDISCAQAVELANALADGATSEEVYSVTGYITEVVSSVSRNQQIFWMADTKDGGRVFEAYWANLPEGVAEFTVGMKVTITGQLMKYVKNEVVTPEIKNAIVVILEEGEGGGGQGGNEGGGDTPSDLVNGGFESWMNDSIPMGWQSASTASSAVLRKSTDAHSGTYACLVTTGGTQNKRLATQEITLEAGSYTFSFYAKSTTADVCQTRAGYVPVIDGAVDIYKYGSYVDINNSEWTLVTYDFELTEKTTLCLLVMNPKNSSYSVSQDFLVDDAALVKK